MKAEYAPERGDLIWLDFTPQAGHEQAGRLPVVEISSRKYNRKVCLFLVQHVIQEGALVTEDPFALGADRLQVFELLAAAINPASLPEEVS